MNLKMAAKVRFYLRVCLVDIDMNDVIFSFPFANLPSFSVVAKALAWRREMRFCLVVSLSLSLARARARN